MGYQVLARKWRPQRFADVLGQSHITRTLQNAIEQDRVGHGYLFVGPRGIGKTTSARIFAKALNCPTPIRDGEGGLEPCCTCHTCQEIAAGSCLDVLEIDGASHNKVDDIREIREGVQYTPTNGRKYKIYIIDEVHMLTAQAWNALLKTLEEPPPHVKFLFATTEAHKVLATIVSRCQRFDLKPIEVPTIVGRLHQIAEEEKVLVDEEALTLIARAAEGGMRDAQSIFDQMISFCGGTNEEQRIHQNDVVEVFGLSSSSELNHLTRAMISNDAVELLDAVHALADKGRDLERMYTDVLGYLRNIMVFQLSKEPTRIVDVSETERVQLVALAQSSASIVQRLIDGLMDDDGGVRMTLNKRLYIEATFLRVMRDAHAVRVDDLLAKLRELEANGRLNDLPRGNEPAIQVSQIAQIHAPLVQPPPPPTATAVVAQPMAAAPPAPVPPRFPAVDQTPEPIAAEPPQQPEIITAAPLTPETAPVAVPEPSTPPEQPAPAPPTHTETPVSLQAVRTAHELWAHLLSVHGESVAALRDAGTAIGLEQDTLLLSATAEPSQAIRQKAAEVGSAHTPPLTINWQVDIPLKRKRTASSEAWEAAEGSEFVQSLCDLFGGKVVDVRG